MRKDKEFHLVYSIHSRTSYQSRRLNTFGALVKLKWRSKAANAKEHWEQRDVAEVMCFLKMMVSVKSLIKREWTSTTYQILFF